MINNNCYNFKLREYNIGIFDNFIDITYILNINIIIYKFNI